LVQGFQQIVGFLWFSNHPTPLTWLPATSSCPPQLKMALKGKRFNDTDTIKENMKKHLKSIPKDSFKKMFPTMIEPLTFQKETTSKGIKYLYL
jgi:hypothetical protein